MQRHAPGPCKYKGDFQSVSPLLALSLPLPHAGTWKPGQKGASGSWSPVPCYLPLQGFLASMYLYPTLSSSCFFLPSLVLTLWCFYEQNFHYLITYVLNTRSGGNQIWFTEETWRGLAQKRPFVLTMPAGISRASEGEGERGWLLPEQRSEQKVRCQSMANILKVAFGS